MFVSAYVCTVFLKKIPFSLCMPQVNVACIALEEKKHHIFSDSFMMTLFMFDAVVGVHNSKN